MDQLLYASDFYPVIRQRIENIDSMRENTGMSEKSFLNEYRTIRINLGRRMGHTTLARKIMELHDDAIVFVLTVRFGEVCFKEYKGRVFSYAQRGWRNSENLNKIVVFDTTFDLSPSALEDVCYSLHPKILILLG